MTYDKQMKFDMPEHQVEKTERGEGVQQNANIKSIKGRKMHMFSVKQNRKSCTFDPSLPNIVESSEAKQRICESGEGQQRSSSTNSLKSSKNSDSSFSKTGSGRKQFRKKDTKVNTSNIDITNSEHSRDVFVPKLEPLGDGRKTPVKRFLQQRGEITMPNLEYLENDREMDVRELSDGVSNAALGYGSPFSRHDSGSITLQKHSRSPMLATQRLSSNKENYESQFQNVNGIPSDDVEKGEFYGISDACSKYVPDTANRLLMEIVYPHEFYDRFQRSGKTSKVIDNLRSQEKERINICKPVTVTQKSCRREKTTISSFQQTGSTRPVLPNTAREASRTVNGDKTVLKRSKTDVAFVGNKHEIHSHCKAKQNVVVFTDDSERQKLVLKGLKGWIVRKEDFVKNRVQRDIKQTVFKISSLGMNFGIPEYNPALSDRRTQSPRPFTGITSARPQDAHQPIRKSFTDLSSPRHQETFVHTVSKPPYAFRRAHTQVPKLLLEPCADEILKEEPINVPTNTPAESARTPKMSLPPIEKETQSRSLTISQF